MNDIVAGARATLAAKGRSFDLAGRFLPSATLDAAAVAYAFCRAVDDAADESARPEDAQAALLRLRGQLEQPSPADPLVRAFVAQLDEAGVPRAVPHELLDGAMRDQVEVRLADDNALLDYSWQVAGTVGIIMCGVLGVADRGARRKAAHLGIAMQITNICRDVLEDAKIGRVYLPASRLIRVGESPERLLSGAADPTRVALVVNELLDLADSFYESGYAGLRYIPLRSRFAIAVASSLYRGIGHKLRRNGGNPLNGRTVLSAWERAGVVLASLGRFVGTLAATRGQSPEAPARVPRLSALGLA